MKRALPVLALTVAGLIPLWRYEPSHDTATPTAGAAPTPAASDSSSKVVAGPTVNTEKGDVQVEVTLDGDTIRSVRMLKQPNSPQTQGAVPTLIQETLKAQSADIDTVSGATITSEGYEKSLQGALDEAGR
ncbi:MULTISPECIES: FMN-binding protein [Streptomyces]|uniref:FMN-binding protein n=1 Tax=Streptomyces TaxID=1883 RepID=UPI0029318536|nr:FMN-binding protein [Streptomyces sp. NEAU-HV9]